MQNVGSSYVRRMWDDLMYKEGGIISCTQDVRLSHGSRHVAEHSQPILPESLRVWHRVDKADKEQHCKDSVG